jgi:hypothetical protein
MDFMLLRKSPNEFDQAYSRVGMIEASKEQVETLRPLLCEAVREEAPDSCSNPLPL